MNKTDAGTTVSYKPPMGNRLKADLGYINLPAVDAANNSQPYVQAVHALLKQIAVTPVCGWVVDVRQNTGGNMYPMLVAIGPLLGDNDLGYFIDKSGVAVEWFYRAGSSGANKTVIFQSEPLVLSKDYSTAPVAMLTSAKTASSGEVVVISFSGRERTKRFGFATMGLTTGNQVYPLADGAALVLAHVREADRHHQVFNGAIQPDVTVKINTFKGDPVLDAAVTWLKQQCAA